jgi:AraC-like DNA-binding protein
MTAPTDNPTIPLRSGHPTCRTPALIAEQLGYGDIYAFSKQFRRQTGMTPSVYRRGRPT